MSKWVFTNALVAYADKVAVAHLTPKGENLLITEVHYHRDGKLHMVVMYWKELNGRVTQLL